MEGADKDEESECQNGTHSVEVEGGNRQASREPLENHIDTDYCKSVTISDHYTYMVIPERLSSAQSFSCHTL